MRSRSRFSSMFLASLCLTLPTGAGAEDEAIDAAEESPAVIHLSLAQAIDNALVNNLDLQISRFAPELALQRWEEAHGAYDPDFFANYGYRSAETPSPFQTTSGGAPVTEIPVVSQRTHSGETGLRGEVPMVGAQYGIHYVGERNVTKGTENLLIPHEYSADLEATLSVPLLRDLIWNQSWTRIQSRELEHSATREGFRTEMMNIARNTERAYWDLIATREKMGVDQKSLETSIALLEQTKAQYEVGTVSKVEVVEADAGVAERELNLIRSENVYRTAQDRLIDIITGSRLRATSEFTVEPTDALMGVEMESIDVATSMQEAEANRPELAAAAYIIDQREVELKFAENQKLPRLDVEGSYGYVGLTGEDRNGNDVGDYWDTHDDFFSDDGNLQWATKGTFSIPLGNRTAKHRAIQADIELRKSHTELARLRQRIVLEVRETVRNLRSAALGITASERRSEAAQEQLRAEEIRLKYGDSTPFDVLQRERDLVDAESQRIGAYQLYRVSLAELERAQGTILKSQNIRIDAEGAVR